MPVFDDKAILFLGLSRLKGIGFRTLRDAGGVDAVAQLVLDGGKDVIDSMTKGASKDQGLEEIYALGRSAAEVLQDEDIYLVRAGEGRFPAQFDDLEPSVRPLWFFYRGNYELLSTEAVAVVGTRSPSDEGAFLTRYAVAAAEEVGVTVVSGLAKGVDEIAHEWSLVCGVPTISVLGTGLLRAYPAKNADLAKKIVDSGGLLISEYLPDAHPTSEGFVWRNRLQAALAKCVIAPEWKKHSGTAHTVRFARRFNRTTINLVLNGCSLSSEHGAADETYEVPRQHSVFLDVLRKVDRYTEERLLNLQQTLF